LIWEDAGEHSSRLGCRATPSLIFVETLTMDDPGVVADH
jgi:hypothetical protein